MSAYQAGAYQGNGAYQISAPVTPVYGEPLATHYLRSAAARVGADPTASTARIGDEPRAVGARIGSGS
jgi:hypothetical protein